MSSFRDQLGEDWLRYQHHLDGGTPTTITGFQTSQPRTQTLTNGVSDLKACSANDLVDQLPPLPSEDDPPLLCSETNHLETESTLRWSQSSQPTESTLEVSVVDGEARGQEGAGSHQSSPDSQRSARASSGGTNQDEEEELGGRNPNP